MVGFKDLTVIIKMKPVKSAHYFVPFRIFARIKWTTLNVEKTDYTLYVILDFWVLIKLFIIYQKLSFIYYISNGYLLKSIVSQNDCLVTYRNWDTLN